MCFVCWLAHADHRFYARCDLLSKVTMKLELLWCQHVSNANINSGARKIELCVLVRPGVN